MGVPRSAAKGSGCGPGRPFLHLCLFIIFPPAHTPSHSSLLLRGLIHTFPGAFYHCQFFFSPPCSPLIRGEGSGVSIGRGAGAADGCSGEAKPGLIHHRHGQSAWAAAGAAAAVCRKASVQRVEPKQVIVGGEEAFFTTDEEGEGQGCANATVKDEFIVVSSGFPFFIF